MYYIKVSMRLSWGFTSRILTTSKTRESYLVPPPTTLIGALAYGYAKLNKIPEETNNTSSAEKIRELVYSVHEKINAPLIQYADLSRIWWYRDREKAAKFDAVALSKIYRGVNLEKPDLEVIYVVKEQDHAKMVAASAHSMVRIGDSHGLVSVEEVEYGALDCSSDNEAYTKYSFWEDLVTNKLPSEALVQVIIDPRKTVIGGYEPASLRRRVYPYSVSLMRPLEINVKIDPERAVICRKEEEVLIIER